MKKSWRAIVEGMACFIEGQSGEEARYPIKQGAVKFVSQSWHNAGVSVARDSEGWKK
jgi:hypothetical protein